MEDVIKIKDLWYTYPGSSEPSLRNINLRIKKGSFTLITGPSGCGKTTLCRCLNGLIPHFHRGTLRGRVLVNGLDTACHSIHRLSCEVGMVFQEPEDQLFCLSVEREVAFGPENLGLPREELTERVEEALSVMKIEHLRHKAPFELSGGERQKVAIAAALALKPSILVLDEPTSNLDPMSALGLIETLAKLSEEDLTIILIEHRLNLAAKYCSQVVLMDGGTIILEGDPREVLSSNIALEVGAAVPKSIILFKHLKEFNLKLEKPPLTSEELVEALVRLIERDRS